MGQIPSRQKILCVPVIPVSGKTALRIVEWEPVMVSEAVKEPDGMVNVIVVALGFVITEAVVPLVPPVMVSPRVKLPLAPTVWVIVPNG